MGNYNYIMRLRSLPTNVLTAVYRNDRLIPEKRFFFKHFYPQISKMYTADSQTLLIFSSYHRDF